MEAIAAQGFFRSPTLNDIERAVELAMARSRFGGRILVDLWDLEQFSRCAHCFDARRRRLHTINLEQRNAPRPRCAHCENGQVA
jgi:hypothetical protein